MIVELNSGIMEHEKTISLNHSFHLGKSRSFRIDFSRVKSVDDVALILSTLDIKITVPDKIDESQFESIEKFLVEA
jgi:hypothetical protein